MTIGIVPCPECEGSLDVSISSEWSGFAERPSYCRTCDKVIWLKTVEDHSGPYVPIDDIPPFELGFKVKVIDEHSVLCGQIGFVIDKDHIHYRVKSGNILVWVPEHWVEAVATDSI